MTDELKNHVSKSVFLAMIGLVIAMSVAVYVRYEKNNEQAAITNYRISQLESENRSLAKKYYRSLIIIPNLYQGFRVYIAKRS